MDLTDKELRQVQKHMEDLARACFEKNIYTFSGFLSLPEQSLFHSMEREVGYAHPVLFGGAENCERVMVRFGSEELLGYEQPFPIILLQVRPLSEKFGEKLGHRDFLGALMSLGVERSVLGDIFISADGKKGYVFCTESMGAYLCENLCSIRHTSVETSVCSENVELLRPPLERRNMTVASARADACICGIFNLSRTKGLTLFKTGKVFVNGREETSAGAQLKQGDVVTVRGFGKFVFDGTDRETRKGKISVGILMYGG